MTFLQSFVSKFLILCLSFISLPARLTSKFITHRGLVTPVVCGLMTSRISSIKYHPPLSHARDESSEHPQCRRIVLRARDTVFLWGKVRPQNEDNCVYATSVNLIAYQLKRLMVIHSRYVPGCLFEFKLVHLPARPSPRNLISG